MEEDVRKVEPRGPTSPDMVVQEVGEDGHRAVIAAPTGWIGHAGEVRGQGPRKVAQVPEDGIFGYERDVIPDEPASECAQIQQTGKTYHGYREYGTHGLKVRRTACPVKRFF